MYDRWRGSRTIYSGGFTKGYWKEVALDEQSAASLSYIVILQALSNKAQLSKDTLTQARLAFYTGKTKPEWEQEYLIAAQDKRNAEQQEIAYAALLAKKREQLALLVTVDNCLKSATGYLRHAEIPTQLYEMRVSLETLRSISGYYAWEVNGYLAEYEDDSTRQAVEASLHEMFNPHHNRWYTDIKWGEQMKRIQAGMTKSGLECIREPDFPSIFYSGHCIHPRPLCEGYRFKKEITDTFQSRFNLGLGLCVVELETGSEEEVSHLGTGSRHETYETLGYVNRKDATLAVVDLFSVIKGIISPLYEDAIFWFAPTCHFSHLALGSCTCETDPTKCPYKGKCICQSCRQLRATAPRLGRERTNKGKHGEDWPALGTWEYTAFPQAVAWIKGFARELDAQMYELNRERKEAEQAQKQNGKQFEEACKRIANYENSQTFIPIAEAESERGVMFL